MSRIVVLGAAGMLGHKVCQQLVGHEIFGLIRQPASEAERYLGIFDGTTLVGGVDVLSPGTLEDALSDLQPDAVVNCVGVVKQLDEAENSYLAIAINALLPHRLADFCAEIGARLIHISTDCVFDGRRGMYVESDLTNARDLYGRSKALGETTEAETAAVTLRTSFIGRELKTHTHGLLEWFLNQEGESVDGYERVIYSGMTSLELAKAIRLIIDLEADLSGVCHVASEPISKYDLLVLMRKVYGLNVEIRGVKEPVSDRSLVMDAFRKATGYVAPSWSEMVERMHQDTTPYDQLEPRKGPGKN